MSVIIILIIALILILLIFKYKNNKNIIPESFIDDFSFLRDYQIMSNKEDWWNKTHARNLYYYQDYVPIYMRE
jgi:hypothetical protein